MNPSSNALRWGTLYNFRFDCNSPPTNGNAMLGTYVVTGELLASTIVPAPRLGSPCPADVSPKGGDGQVNVNDLLALINSWGPCAAPCPADITCDGSVNVNDLLAVINAWGPCR